MEVASPEELIALVATDPASPFRTVKRLIIGSREKAFSWEEQEMDGGEEQSEQKKKEVKIELLQMRRPREERSREGGEV